MTLTEAYERGKSARISCIIPALNEEEHLPQTLAALRGACPGLHEQIVIDDASATPQPGATIRNERRMGCARSRHIAWRRATGDAGYLCDSHHPAICPGGPEMVVGVALAENGIAYAACDGHRVAELRWDQGILRCKWVDYVEAGAYQRKTALMGAGYGVGRATLEKLGGWPPLPNYIGWDEEAVSILAWFMDIPIFAVPSVNNGHVWREQGENPIPVPYVTPWDRQINGLVQLLRWAFTDDCYKSFWLPRLKALRLDGKPPVPEHVFVEVEDDAQLTYGRWLRSRFVMTETAFFEAFREKAPAIEVKAEPKAEPVKSVGDKISCLTATHGRFKYLRQALACWMLQTHKNKELIILNNHPTPIRCEVPGVRVYNEPKYASLGACRNRLLELATGDYVRTWDDDDLYWPTTLQQGVENIGGAPAFKPRRSWSWRQTENRWELADNVFEAAMLVRADVARKYRYQESGGDEHSPLLAGIEKEGGCRKVDCKATYAYRWASPLHRISGTLGRGELWQRTADWMEANQDDGGWEALTPDFESVKRHFADCARAAAHVPWNVDANELAQGSANYGDLLPMLIRQWRVRTVIAIGICRGWTSAVLGRALAENCPGDGVLLSVDIEEGACKAGKAQTDGLPLQHVVLCANSGKVDYVAELAKLGRDRAELILVDGDHRGEQPLLDLKAVEMAIPENGLIVVHDYAPGQPDVMNAANAWAKAHGWPIINLPEDRERGYIASAIIQRRTS